LPFSLKDMLRRIAVPRSVCPLFSIRTYSTYVAPAAVTISAVQSDR